MNLNIVKWIVFFILFLIGLFCYMKDYGYANEGYFSNISIEEECLFQFHQPIVCRVPWGRPNQQIKANQRQEWQEAYDNHHYNAVRTYQDAYNRVWFLPDLTWRQIGRDCWVSACAMASTNTPSTALVMAFSTMLSQYGLHCLDEWDYIQEKLSWSQYHFEQCAYYSNLLYGN